MKKDYRDLLREISILNEEYHMTIEGRKKIINDIREKSREIRKMTSVCNPELDELDRYYSYRDYYISDYKMAMSLLLRLANNNEDLYAMKEVRVTNYFIIGKENRQLYGKVLFITDKNLMKKYNSDMYYYDEFVEKATRDINKGHSMIIVTNNLFESYVKPREEKIMCDSVFDIKNGGTIGNITCYVNGLTLKDATDKFTNYVEINGPDFSNIDEDSLFDLMNGSYKTEKTLLK